MSRNTSVKRSMLSKTIIFQFLLIISTTGIDGRVRRQRRGIWPDVLAPGGNTFATRGYYGMQSYIAYPESGIAFNPYAQGWNPYGQGYYPQNQFNNYNPYGNNQPYPYGPGQNMAYGGFPSNDQGNYNGYYPNTGGNVWIPPGGNMGGPLRAGIIYPRTGGNIGAVNAVERTRRQALPTNT